MAIPTASESGTELTLEAESQDLGPLLGTGSGGPSPERSEAELAPKAQVSSGLNLIDLYLQLTAELPSPEIFRKWTAIHAVGAALERRVWSQLGANRLHPNLFLFLVGPPGVGKTQALAPMENILRKANPVALAPNDLTKQGLLDCLSKAQKGALILGKPFDYHFLALHIRELSNFMSQYDIALAGLLTDLFDCPQANEEHKRGHDKGKMIEFPGISFIMGTATQQLGKSISEDMWGSGFMARVIMIFSADNIIPADTFAMPTRHVDIEDELIAAFSRLGDLKGPMGWTPEGRAALHDFRVNQEKDAPTHNRLSTYRVRRWLHLCKLCMISALADERMEVTLEDIFQAIEWLVEAESYMPEIFKDLQSHEDGQVHLELHGAMVNMCIMNGNKPVRHSQVVAWLSKRVATHNVMRILEVALHADYFRRVAGTEGEDAEYVPTRNITKDLGAL